MKKLAVLNVVGLTKSLIGEHTPSLKKFLEEGWGVRLAEPFPAVTCTSQSNMLTGEQPSVHGAVANGWYFKDLAEVGFWKQNNGLVQAPKVWERLRENNPDFTCAKIFWWYNMYSSANWTVTPRPHYPADGRKVFDIYTQPMEMGKEMKKDLGDFPFFSFWGPKAGLPSSKWIADSAKWIYKKHAPDLNLVYLPHLDYGLQKFGPSSPKIISDLQAVDGVVGDLIQFYQSQGVDVMIVSEYGITDVSKVVYPNRVLREKGYIQVRESLDWELLDFGASQAFAVCDHQAAHIYVKDKAQITEVAELFESIPGQKEVLAGSQIVDIGLDHERAGDVVLMADPDTWYAYYYWMDDKKAPDFARCVDIHRKPGYDPVEMFLDPKLSFPKLKVMKTLAKKSLGFRYYMDVIPLDASLVGGSHGTPVEEADGGPVCFSQAEGIKPEESMIPMAQVHNLILNYFS